MNKPLKKISPDLVELFMNKTWDGNVRELENVIMQGISFSTTDEINPRDMELSDKKKSENIVSGSMFTLPYKTAKEKTLKQFNHDYIGHLLGSHNGNVTQAAKKCGLERQALQQIMRRFGVKADEFRQ